MALKRYPGLIDVHVHLREPGATHKEDFYTGSRAAIKGGFTFIIDMPNNVAPVVSSESLNEKISLADQKSICDVGFHYGTNGFNTDTFNKVWNNPRVFGLKIYCNHTTGEMLIEEPVLIDSVFKNWESDKPILVHAEGPQLAMAIEMADKYKRKLHICHISLAEEVDMLRRAKLKGQVITAGVCPHHLFMTGAEHDKMKGYAMMKPPLGTQKDQEALWRGLNDGTVDLVETDHAPHTKEEKEKNPPAFGVPGLEWAVGLLGKAIKEKRIPEHLFRKVLHDNPKKIFMIPDQKDTFVEIDFDKRYIVGEEAYETKCGWSPYEGWELVGMIETVRFKGKDLIKEGKFL
ncbi:MAG: amidohydrolase family protein [Parcubacteria group bacterium]|nr:amidohydrolase family protein [Parcubacteria group bacterium]